MRDLRYTLLTDGSSDAAFLSIIDWLINDLYGEDLNPIGQWADLRKLRKPPKQLDERIRTAYKMYPCDVFFIHRDSENEPLSSRELEIDRACTFLIEESIPYIRVIPVRMIEAWLLIDEQAILKAAGNPNFKVPPAHSLPARKQLEKLSNPKARLHQIFRLAHEGKRRRRRKTAAISNIRIAELIPEFSGLRNLDAFQAFEAHAVHTLSRLASPEPRQ